MGPGIHDWMWLAVEDYAKKRRKHSNPRRKPRADAKTRGIKNRRRKKITW